MNDPAVPHGIERLEEEWLVLMRCHATDGRLEWALVESCVYRWGKAGSDVRLEWLHVESSVCIDEEWLAATHVRLEGLVE